MLLLFLSHLHHLILTKFVITDILARKAALSDTDTFTYDQVLLDPDIDEWKKSDHKEIMQHKSTVTWVEVPTSESSSKILPCTWVFHCMRAHTGIITKFTTRYCVRGDYKKIQKKLTHQLSHGEPSGLSLSSHSPKVGISSVWTSIMPSSKLTSRIQSG